MHQQPSTVHEKYNFLSSISDAAVPMIEDRAGAEVVNYYFTEDASLTLTCKITAEDGEYGLTWHDGSMSGTGI